jgi:hypothetical protein
MPTDPPTGWFINAASPRDLPRDKCDGRLFHLNNSNGFSFQSTAVGRAPIEEKVEFRRAEGPFRAFRGRQPSARSACPCTLLMGRVIRPAAGGRKVLSRSPVLGRVP